MLFGRRLFGTRSHVYNFTDRVRMVLGAAREEALRLGHDHVGPEHILLGLVAIGGGVAASVLESFSATPEELRRRVEEAAPPGTAEVRTGELPYTSGAKRVLEIAMREARDLDHSYVGTEHLLLGLVGEGHGIAARVLAAAGLTPEATRAEVLRLLGAAPRTEPGFAVRIDDESSSSIYEQIVAQVQEAVATRRLQPGERLPTVRQLADQLDVAPGTVARAYAELERLGVVVTEGARGTRVAERERRAFPDDERPETLVGLLRPVAVAAFHLGATAREVRQALEEAMRGIFPGDEPDRTEEPPRPA